MHQLAFILLFCTGFMLNNVSDINGEYIGAERLGKIANDGRKWYHLTLILIQEDSIFMNQVPISVKRKDTFYSASDGGFYNYAGKIRKENKDYIAELKMIDCDYCPKPVKFDSVSKQYVEIPSPHKILNIKVVGKGLLINNNLYRHKD
jgi:hypothetical protein